MPPDDQFVEVGGLGGIQDPQGEVIDDEESTVGEATDLGREALVQPGGA